MSSPNLNVLTLLGSILTYSSGFLFAFDGQAQTHGGASTVVLQVSSTVSFDSLLDIGEPKSVLDNDTISNRPGCGHFVSAVRWCLAQFWGRRGGCTGCSPRECLTREW